MANYVHPGNEAEIAALIQRAAQEKKLVRVRGSAHSVPAAISPNGGKGSDATTYELLLDRMIALQFDDAAMRVRAQAGCHLGMDPEDPAGTSIEANGLFPQLDKRGSGWAVPDMGGIIHQSVGGFLSTGSSGGSLQTSIYDSIVAIKLIDGTGTTREYRRGRDDEFHGAVISLGLLGVVVEVEFACIPRYHVKGRELTTKTKDSHVDMFGPGTFERYLRDTEHSRLLWWPQKDVEKLVVWEAHTMQPDDYDAETGPPHAFKPKRYELMDRIFGSKEIPQTLANKIFKAFGRLNPPPPTNAFDKLKDAAAAKLYAPIVNSFLKVNAKDPKRFWELWWHVLPMDDDANDHMLPTEFTELWIPIQHTQEVMQVLEQHYRKYGWNATGTYANEIYAAKASDLWLSPAYKQDVLRVDLFWFGKQQGRPERDYYPQFWELLDRFQPRYHWGKHMPVNPGALRSRYPKMNDFLALRAALDPHGVFLTPYWRERFGL